MFLAPVVLPSITVQNVTKKREVEHNKRLDRMEEGMAEINIRVESKIRLKSQWIKEECSRVQTQSENKVADTLTDPLKVGTHLS